MRYEGGTTMIENEYKVFESLNKKLSSENIYLSIICVGGFVLSHYGMRATQDIDGFYETSKKVDALIKSVGEEFDLNTNDEIWLNNSVQNMNDKPPEAICDILYEFSNLTILTPPLDYIAGMKLVSARGQDIEDVAEIIRKQKIPNPEELEEKLKDYGFDSIDESLILEAFGLAYGFEWLEKYYIANEERINKKIKESR